MWDLLCNFVWLFICSGVCEEGEESFWLWISATARLQHVLITTNHVSKYVFVAIFLEFKTTLELQESRWSLVGWWISPCQVSLASIFQITFSAYTGLRNKLCYSVNETRSCLVSIHLLQILRKLLNISCIAV